MRHYCCISHDSATGDAVFVMVSGSPINRKFRVIEQKGRFDPVLGYVLDGPIEEKVLRHFSFDPPLGRSYRATDIRDHLEEGPGNSVQWKSTAPIEMRGLSIMEEVRGG